MISNTNTRLGKNFKLSKYIPLVLILFFTTWSGNTFAIDDEENTTTETVSPILTTQAEEPKIDHRLRWTLLNRKNKKNLNTRNFKKKWGTKNSDSEKIDRREDRRSRKGFGRRRSESTQKRDKTNWRSNIQRYSMRSEGQTRKRSESKSSTRMEDRLKNRRVPYFQKRRYVEQRMEMAE